MNRKIAGLLLLGMWMTSEAAQASDGALSITVENDVFSNSDNNYTNGIGIAWISAAVDTDDDGFLSQWTRFWSFLPFVGDDGYTTYASWSLVQEMNTPDDIENPDPSEDDQPYSGILYIDNTLYTRKETWTHVWQLKLGVVGPASQADVTQREFHKLIGADKPQGWHTQLPNEPIVNLGYTAAHLLKQGDAGESAEWRIVPVSTVGIGNYFTGAGFGTYGEIGWNLLDALGVSALRSGLNAASTIGVEPEDRWSVSFSGGVGVYGVAYYLPLDGTMFHDSRSVDSEPVIGMASVGFSVRHGRFALSYAQTRFTDTFKTQRRRTDFGTMGVSWVF